MRKIVKVFQESSPKQSWFTRVMCDDGTTWYLDESKYHDWQKEGIPAIPQEDDPNEIR